MKRVVVVGLGIFGFNIAKDLFENGFEVIAIDKNKDVVNRIRDFSTKAVLADATDRELLEMIGIQPDDLVIISFGEDLAASTLLTLHLKEMNIKSILVKAPNEDHKRILEKVGATEVIIPEKAMASKVAKGLISPNVLDFLPISEDFTISEVAPPAGFLGKTLADLRLRGKYHVEVIAIRDVLSDKIQLVPRADFVIKDSDILIVIGKEADIQKIQ
ncbi:MAG TPA: TrkA family potassium uptake protein [Thermodesulfobacteriota bacterium]|nr:TrkA family potassium uptake protein [Thermodesulfobacteriota bacterium]